MEWLHLCDFHVGGKSGPLKQALQSQLEAIKKPSSEEGWKLDAVFLVGDIAWSGAKEQYERFDEFFLQPLKQIPAAANALFVAVPGNHDIDCEITLPISWDQIGEPRRSMFFCEDGDGLKTRKARAFGFTNYSNWLNGNKLVGPDPLKEVGIIHFCENLPVNLLATNTSFFSDYTEDSSQPITPIPLASLRELVSGANKDKPFLIIGHHSWNSFLKVQESQFSTLLRENNAVYLHGHEHAPQSQFGNNALKCLGFGACYPGPKKDNPDSVYKHTFTYCKLSANLEVRAFTWEHSGEWIDTSAIQFPDLLTSKNQNGFPIKIANFPLISAPVGPAIAPVAISTIQRIRATPSEIIPVGPNWNTWKRVFPASEQLRPIITRGDFSVTKHPTEDGKLELIGESGSKRHLIICVSALNHILSESEVEGMNTRLDSEDFESVTLLSLGRLSDPARTLYIRLKSKKRIEILGNRALTEASPKLLSNAQQSAISELDSATSDVRILIGEEEIHVLVVDSSTNDSAFYVLNSEGAILEPTNGLVVLLREGTPEFERMPYAGHITSSIPQRIEEFDEFTYLQNCRSEYNSMKYAALASVGVRFSDLPLDDLYVSATASEVTEDTSRRLEDVVADHLSSVAASEAIKTRIKTDLLSTFGSESHKETSYAREFCQRYGSVLIVGDPGSGKTCFVKNEILSYCDRSVPGDDSTKIENWYSSHIPVMLMLSEVAAEKDLEEKGLIPIAARLLSRRGLAFPEDDLEVYSKRGKIAWFFDGLDEVVSVERRAIIVQQINDLVTQSFSTGNRIAVTSRPAAIHVVNLLSALHKLEIQGFSEAQIRELAEKALNLKVVESPTGVMIEDDGTNAPKNERLIERLLSDCRKNNGIARLAQNPLLLTLLIMIYANKGAPSAKRHVIYAQAIETLVSVRARETGQNKKSALSSEDLKDRLGAVAVSIYQKTSGLLPTRREISQIIQEAMSRSRGESVSYSEANEFIQKVAESTGLVAIQNRVGEPDDEAIFTFMHHSFLEYFAAIGLSRRVNSVNLKELVSQPRWHEVLTLLAGVLSENEDIAPIIRKILEPEKGSMDTNAKLLCFSMECALECDVPSEGTQRVLATQIERCLSEGPARRDPWVRSEIGSRIEKLRIICGEALIDEAIARQILSPDGEIASAAICTAAYACGGNIESNSILRAIEKSCTRIEEGILSAICFAAANSSFLRTEQTKQVIARCLKKSPRAKGAALDAISSIPGLASSFWGEIIEIISDGGDELVVPASKAALRAGLNADLISLQALRKDVLLKALNSVESAGDGEMLRSLPKVKQTTFEFLWTSAQERDRLLAIQLTPFTDAPEQFLYERLIEVIKGGTDRREVASALLALSDGKASALIRNSDLKRVAQRMSEGTSDVRLAAVRLLGCFGGEPTAIEPLLATDLREIGLEQYRAVVLAMSRSSAHPKEVSAFLFKEVRYLLDDKRRANFDRERMLNSVLAAVRQLKRPAPHETVGMLKEFILDYRNSQDLKRSALLAFAAIAEPLPINFEFLFKFYSMQIPGIEEALAQIPSIVAAICKQNVEYLIERIDMLSALRDKAIELYKRVALRRISQQTENLISRLRDGIEELEQLIVTFHDFLKGPSSST